MVFNSVRTIDGCTVKLITLDKTMIAPIIASETLNNRLGSVFPASGTELTNVKSAERLCIRSFAKHCDLIFQGLLLNLQLFSRYKVPRYPFTFR